MAFIGDILEILTGLTGIFDDVDHLIDNTIKLTANIRGEIDALKKFKAEPKWKTRVINVPAAIQKSKDFVVQVSEEIHTAFKQFVDDVKAIRAITPPHPRGGGGVNPILKLIGDLRLFITSLNNAVLALEKFVEAIAAIQKEIETLDTLFLGQENQRKRLSGAHPFIRVGKLH